MLDEQCSAALKLGGLREQPQLEVRKDELFARARATEFCFDFAHGPKIVAERRQQVPPKGLIFYSIKLLPTSQKHSALSR